MCDNIAQKVRDITMNNACEMRLYDESNDRLYINPAERQRLIEAAERTADLQAGTLCLTLLYTGCRISEALELTVFSIQSESRLISVRCLKKRNRHVIREIPVPPALVARLEQVHSVSLRQKAGAHSPWLWASHGSRINRSTAYRWVKQVMQESGIAGRHASPKGLRHGYGIHAIRSGIPLHMLRKWMGHASMTTTAIYASAIGREEIELADKMW